MKDNKLWHRQQITRRLCTFQEDIVQLVVPKSERADIINVYHSVSLAHSRFLKTYKAVT